MITKEAAIQKFKDILMTKASWKILSKSQFVNHLAIFVSWCLRESLWKIERAIQEYFISTALNDSSIMAHAEDREYVPRKRTPATGTATITNEGAAAIALPIETALQSSEQIDYLTNSEIIVPAGASRDVEIQQARRETFQTTVQEKKAFYEVLLDRSLTQKIASFRVYVDIENGAGFEEWQGCRLFQNTDVGDKVYDEYYSRTGQSGIRFGNEYVGTVLPVGSKVRIELLLTEGDTYLAENQELLTVGEILDVAGQPASMKIVAKDAVTNGSDREGIEEIRNHLHYWHIYNHKLVWRDDYIYFVRRTIGNILWIRVWGEEEAEEQAGAPSIDFINKIFVSAYAPAHNNIDVEIMRHLRGVPLLNRKFVWVVPQHAQFGVTVTGKIAKMQTISDAAAATRNALIANYGKDVPARRDKVLLKDIYNIINDTKYFSDAGAYFEVETTGNLEPTALHEMVSIDENNIMITLTYL